MGPRPGCPRGRNAEYCNSKRRFPGKGSVLHSRPGGGARKGGQSVGLTRPRAWAPPPRTGTGPSAHAGERKPAAHSQPAYLVCLTLSGLRFRSAEPHRPHRPHLLPVTPLCLGGPLLPVCPGEDPGAGAGPLPGSPSHAVSFQTKASARAQHIPGSLSARKALPWGFGSPWHR